MAEPDSLGLLLAVDAERLDHAADLLDLHFCPADAALVRQAAFAIRAAREGIAPAVATPRPEAAGKIDDFNRRYPEACYSLGLIAGRDLTLEPAMSRAVGLIELAHDILVDVTGPFGGM